MKRQKILLLRLTLVVVVVVVVVLRLYQPVLFGHGPTWRGGAIGRRIDNSIKTLLFHAAVRRHRDAFCHVVGDPLLAETSSTNQVGTPVLTQAWLAATLMQARRRQDAIDAYYDEQQTRTSDPAIACQQDDHDWARQLQPVVGDWYRRPASENVLQFDLETMEELISTEFSWLYQSVHVHLTETQKVELWAICAVYHYGGVFVAPFLDSATTTCVQAEFWKWQQEECQVPQKLWFQAEMDLASIDVLAGTREHPQLKCVLNSMQSRVTQSSPSQGPILSWQAIMQLLATTRWNEAEQSCQVGNAADAKVDPRVTVPQRDAQREGNIGDAMLPRFQVQIVMHSPHEKHLPVDTKDPWSMRLQHMGCSAGWFCQRCLRMPWRGTLPSCRRFCRSCYEESLCRQDEHQHDAVIMEIVVTEQANSPLKRIPRIVHQTWFEELTTDRYPHLQRMQHSWMASGWDYRFYNDTSARDYIVDHFPYLFVNAYDAILPGAFKADLFRLLVLLKDGGIYADIDVQLEVHLDAFLTTNLSFFVPRDCPIDYWPDSNYCMWNGLMGAAPGHPIVVQAVEDVMNRILQRHDYYDIESELCQEYAHTEIWKLRTLPILLLTGPCALGISINRALGRENPLEGFDWGWLPSSDPDWGDALVLVADRYDMGELRFTDLGRNLLVASTNQDRVAKSPIQVKPDVTAKESKHYSQSESEIAGEYGVYKDNQKLKERIRLVVKHSHV